jgi:hypothetical protein
MEVSHARNQLRRTIEAAKQRSLQRRQQVAAAEAAYRTFLEQVAIPVTRQLANALKAEGHAFTVFTPGGGLRLASDRAREDYIEFALDTDAETPQVVGRVSRGRGSRTVEEERPLKAGAAPEHIGEEDVLAFLLDALEPWLGR